MTLAASLAPPYGAPLAIRRPAAPALLVTALVHAIFAALAWSALQAGTRPTPIALDGAAPAIFFLLPNTGERRGPVTPEQRPGVAARPGERIGAGRLAEPAVAARLDARYVSGHVLQIGPEPAGAPNFATALNRPNHVGSVTLRVYVSKFGLPDRVEIRGQPEDPEFARDLQRALEQTSFLPGRQAGRDIASYVDYEFSGGVVEVRLAQRPGAS